MARPSVPVWDVTALVNAADPKASLPERHLWLIRLLEWLRHAPVPAEEGQAPKPVARLKHLLNLLERHPEHRERVAAMLAVFWREIDTAALFADFGFSSGTSFVGEIARRLRVQWLPLTPATADLGELFGLLFPHADDARWLDAIDHDTLARLVRVVGTARGAAQWRTPLVDAVLFLSSEVRASGFSPLLRQRMSAQLLAEAPFRQLARVAEHIGELVEAGDHAALLREGQYLRALLQSCRRCADSVHDHLEEHGISINVVFELEQLRERTHRIEDLLNCMLSPTPEREVARLIADLVRTAQRQRSVRALFAQHYSLLARKMTERSASSGEHYITRNRGDYWRMLRAAMGGGMVIAGTTFIKFAVLAIGLSAFWGGFWAGINYAISFVLVHLAHWTIATKQPAMTAPALAEKLGDMSRDDAVEGFVDEVVNMIRSQSAAIFGNLVIAGPLTLAVQLGWTAAFGAPLVGPAEAHHAMSALTLLGPTAFYAAITGVLLFGSSVIAGWVENWFVWHRLDSAIEWNPRFVARLGAARARRWAAWWRANISGLTSNIALGMMLGLVPVVAHFFALPIDVRHVSLSTAQLGVAVGAEGFGLLATPLFWWCMAGLAVTATLNVSVSFFLAFKLALRSRGVRLADRSRIYAAIRRRLRTRPLSFLWPPRAATKDTASA